MLTCENQEILNLKLAVVPIPFKYYPRLDTVVILLCFTIFLKSKVDQSCIMPVTKLFLQHIRKYGSAFLNCDGGVLIAGILDNGNY